MSQTNQTNLSTGQEREKAAAITRAIESRDWDTFDRLTGMSPEEAERILKEEPMVDAAEVFRMLEITDEEIAEVLKSPPSDELPLNQKAQKLP